MQQTNPSAANDSVRSQSVLAKDRITVVPIEPRLLSPVDAGRYIAKSPRWLKAQRAQDRIRVEEECLPAIGPKPTIIRGRVFYEVSDLDEWIESEKRR